MEHHGVQYPAPHRIRPDPLGLLLDPGPEVGPTAGHSRDFRGLGPDARAHVLLFGPREAHLGDHVVLPPPRPLPGGGGPPQEGPPRYVPVAAIHIRAVGCCVRDGHRLLAVLSPTPPMQSGRQGV